MQFKRTDDPKKTLDVGIDRSSNPHNLGNSEEYSYWTDKTNEEYLSAVSEDLRELIIHIHTMFSSEEEEERAAHPSAEYQYNHPRIEKVLDLLDEAVEKVEETIKVMNGVKI